MRFERLLVITGGSTHGMLLEWGNGQHMMRVAVERGPFDWIVGSDLAYDTVIPPNPHLFPRLILA